MHIIMEEDNLKSLHMYDSNYMILDEQNCIDPQGQFIARVGGVFNLLLELVG